MHPRVVLFTSFHFARRCKAEFQFDSSTTGRLTAEERFAEERFAEEVRFAEERCDREIILSDSCSDFATLGSSGGGW